MHKFVAAIGCVGLLASTSAQALFIDFETGLGRIDADDESHAGRTAEQCFRAQ